MTIHHSRLLEITKMEIKCKWIPFLLKSFCGDHYNIALCAWHLIHYYATITIIKSFSIKSLYAFSVTAKRAITIKKFTRFAFLNHYYRINHLKSEIETIVPEIINMIIRNKKLVHWHIHKLLWPSWLWQTVQ